VEGRRAGLGQRRVESSASNGDSVVRCCLRLTSYRAVMRNEMKPFKTYIKTLLKLS
jgi:hypothetical protein